jgi:hypothetical protein
MDQTAPSRLSEFEKFLSFLIKTICFVDDGYLGFSRIQPRIYTGGLVVGFGIGINFVVLNAFQFQNFGVLLGYFVGAVLIGVYAGFFGVKVIAFVTSGLMAGFAKMFAIKADPQTIRNFLNNFLPFSLPLSGFLIAVSNLLKVIQDGSSDFAPFVFVSFILFVLSLWNFAILAKGMQVLLKLSSFGAGILFALGCSVMGSVVFAIVLFILSAAN